MAVTAEYTLESIHDHHIRSAQIADRLAVALGLDETMRNDLKRAALLHDVGKRSIPDRVLYKQGLYTKLDREIMKTHVIHGVSILRTIHHSGVDISLETIQAVAQHHENWDGSGYPYGLQGEEISTIARALRIADFYEALTSPHRTYRPRLDRAGALDLMRECLNCFDPDIFEIFTSPDLKDDE